MPGQPEATTLETVEAAPRTAGRPTCGHCITGDCERCTRVGCFHQCPGMRKFGLASASEGAEHGAPGPGRR